MKFTATSIDFSNILHLESTVNTLQPEVKMGNLNSYLYFDPSQSKLYFFVKGNIALGYMEIDAAIESDATSPFSIMLNMNNITHLVLNYNEDIRKNVIMTVEINKDKSIFNFSGNNDKINFAHILLAEAECKEIGELILNLGSSTKKETEVFNFNLKGEARQYLLQGITNCLDFIEDDDTRNNALALYPTKLVASDNRHIFIYNLVENLLITSDSPVSLHKSITKIILSLDKVGGEPTFILYSNNHIYLESAPYHFKAILNNNIAKISPPNEEDLVSLAPTNQIGTMTRTMFDGIIDFFLGFYATKVNYKVITLETSKDALTFILKDSGVAGYNSSHVERKIEMPINGEGFIGTVIIDSIKSFIKHLTKDDTISIMMDEDHKAIVLQSNRKTIYLAKDKKKA